jgi:hypothetical protein
MKLPRLTSIFPCSLSLLLLRAPSLAAAALGVSLVFVLLRLRTSLA